MTKLELAKQIISANRKRAECGIYNTRNIVGDPMFTLYDDGELKIDVCDYYEYFEVFGLPEEEFAELKRFYGNCNEGEKRRGKWIPFLPEYGDMFQCSVCKEAIRLPYKPKDFHIAMPYNFCPICGATMAGENDGH